MKGSACISPKGFHFSVLSLREASGTSWVLSLTKAQRRRKKKQMIKKKKIERKSESKHDFLFSRRRANFYFIVTALRSAAVGLHGRGL